MSLNQQDYYNKLDSVIEGIKKRDRRSIARAISIIDNNEPYANSIIQNIFKLTGNAITIGFTGAGGAGKSSLIGQILSEFQNKNYKVAILAVDPTSPVTGGAILGDRVRMQKTMDDREVFMRSLASRGAIGGISKSLRNVIRILDAAGYNLILVESVGAGQLEIEISKVVNITAVVFSPQTGDNIQAVKAGINEIGDVYVINKGDLEGSSILYNSIRDFIGDTARKPPVIKVSAKTQDGLTNLVDTFEKIIAERKDEFRSKEKKMLEMEVNDMVLNMVQTKVISLLSQNQSYLQLIEKICSKEIDPFNGAKETIKSILRWE